MTAILTDLCTENIDDARFVRLVKPFIFESDVLRKAGLQSRVMVPPGFVYDFESIPVFRGTSKRGGTAHDYLCRMDSVPLVDKTTAAKVYLEIMTFRDGFLPEAGISHFLARWGKYAVVRIWPNYFHKLPVTATYEEVARNV